MCQPILEENVENDKSEKLEKRTKISVLKNYSRARVRNVAEKVRVLGTITSSRYF